MTRIADPNQYSSGYSVDLYCDQDHGWEHIRDEFHGERLGDCLRQARRRGWVIHRDRTATCPSCNRKKP